MRRSSSSARLITILIAVVLTPVALGLLATGGTPWLMAVFRYASPGPDLGVLAGPMLLQVLAIAMLVVVVLTGIWSSAGLIAVGILSIVPVLIALAPGLLVPVYRLPLPREWIDGLSYGIPLLIMPTLGMMGVVLAAVRRRPEPRGIGLGIAGYVLAPLLLAGGAWLVLWGVGRGMRLALQQFRFDFVPEAFVAVIGGLLLVLAGIAATRWSPFALLLPATVLIVLTAVAVFPSASSSLFVALPRELLASLPTVLLIGGGMAAAIVFVTFTVTLARVRSRARLAETDMPASDYPPAGYAPGTYPPQTYAPAGQTHPPAGQPYPPAG